MYTPGLLFPCVVVEEKRTQRFKNASFQTNELTIYSNALPNAINHTI
jgi:hypothetical protein